SRAAHRDEVQDRSESGEWRGSDTPALSLSPGGALEGHWKHGRCRQFRLCEPGVRRYQIFGFALSSPASALTPNTITEDGRAPAREERVEICRRFTAGR